MSTRKETPVPSFLSLCADSDIIVRSTKTSLLIGTILAVINHGDKFISGELDSPLLLKIALTYLVPYGVSTFAVVQTLRRKSESC